MSRHRAALLQVCRTLPWALSKYRLDELTTVRELQKVIEKRFRDNWFVRDPRVRCLALGYSALTSCVPLIVLVLTLALSVLQAIDLLIFKGKEELDVRGPCFESLADSCPCCGRGAAWPACQGLCTAPTLTSLLLLQCADGAAAAQAVACLVGSLQLANADLHRSPAVRRWCSSSTSSGTT